jgi:CubicO group peptidase (beta-lactamase class C family)
MRSSRLSRLTLLPLLFLLLSARALAAPIDWSLLSATVAAELHQGQIPGCAVAVVVDGKLAWARGYGVASIETGQPVEADMLFRLGSTTKMFTAAGLVSLAVEGRVRLDAPVGQVVQGLPPAISRLTPHQLLTHTAGLADPNAMDGPHDETALAERVRALGPDDFFDEPGRIYSYSNAGFWIAGFVAQEASGARFADLLHERLFQPLGMTRSTFRPTMAMTWPLAVGHGPENRAPAKVVRPLADNAAVWPAGQLFSTAPEFARFCIALMDEGRFEGRTVLPAALVAQLTRPHVAVPHEDRHYGYGLGLRLEGGLRWWSHGGSRTGYGSLVRMCPERKFAVIILCNKTGASLPKVADHAVQLALGLASPTPPPRRVVPMAAAEMSRYAGTYSNGRSSIVLRVQAGKLVAATGGEITKRGEHHFSRAASAGAPALDFTLVADATGRITHLTARGRAWRRTD